MKLYSLHRKRVCLLFLAGYWPGKAYFIYFFDPTLIWHICIEYVVIPSLHICRINILDSTHIQRVCAYYFVAYELNQCWVQKKNKLYSAIS